MNSFIQLFFLLLPLGILSGGGENPDNRYHRTDEGPVIQWNKNTRLKWEDFQAKRKLSPGFGIASTYSDFVYDVHKTDSGEYLKVHVWFYCYKSWKNKWYRVEDVLAHEQLHFDITEMYGRIFCREVQRLMEKDAFNDYTLRRSYSNLQKKCNDYQDLYDEETGSSTVESEQKRWNTRVKKEMENLSEWSDYGWIRLP